MAAMLERHGKDQKPTPGNIPAKEIIHCSNSGCAFSYTLSCSEDENFLIVGEGELNVDKMHRLAVAVIESTHPAHLTKNYVWKGAEHGWVEADSMAARKTL